MEYCVLGYFWLFFVINTNSLTICFTHVTISKIIFVRWTYGFWTIALVRPHGILFVEPCSMRNVKQYQLPISASIYLDFRAQKKNLSDIFRIVDFGRILQHHLVACYFWYCRCFSCCWKINSLSRYHYSLPVIISIRYAFSRSITLPNNRYHLWSVQIWITNHNACFCVHQIAIPMRCNMSANIVYFG